MFFVNINFPGGRERQVEKSRKFQGGGGSKTKNPPWGGMDIFWNHTIGVVSGVRTIPVSSDSAYDSDLVKTRLSEL